MNKKYTKWIFCGLAVILGLLLFFVFPGYDFSGLFSMGLAALVPIYHILKNRKALTRILTSLLVIFFAAIGITSFIIHQASLGTAKPDSDYLIVLGAGVNGTSPSRILRERLDAALGYLETHPDAVAILSGGKGDGENISEAQCMFNYLTEAGIDPDRVWLEDQATNTIENLEFSLDIIENRTGTRPDQAAIVSSEFHLYRANQFAKGLGLEAELVPAKTTIIPLRWNYYLREVFAVWYYLLFGG